MKHGANRFSEILPLVFSVLICLFSIWMLFASRLPLMDIHLERLRGKIQADRREVKQLLANNARMMRDLAPYWAMNDGALKAASERDAMLLFRERLESAASKSGIQSRNMSNVQKLSITEHLTLLEVTFSADGKTAELVEFLRSLSQDRPVLYWKTVSIKPVQETLTVSGTLCVLCILTQEQDDAGETGEVQG